MHRLRAQLPALLPGIKALWLTRLRATTTTPLAQPDALAFLMDGTLMQWRALLVTDRATWLKHCPPPAVNPRRACGCGHNPFAFYFAAGETALETVLLPDHGSVAIDAIDFFRLLGRRDIGAWCSLCQHAASCSRE